MTFGSISIFNLSFTMVASVIRTVITPVDVPLWSFGAIIVHERN